MIYKRFETRTCKKIGSPTLSLAVMGFIGAEIDYGWLQKGKDPLRWTAMSFLVTSVSSKEAIAFHAGLSMCPDIQIKPVWLSHDLA